MASVLAFVWSVSLLAVLLPHGSVGQIDWFAPSLNGGGGGALGGRPEQPSFQPIKIEDAGYPSWDQMPNNPSDRPIVKRKSSPSRNHNIISLPEKTTPSASVLGIESDNLPGWEQMPDNPPASPSDGANPTEN
ncbi:hypothetical protein niasHS_014961 [Heterodera schachtii]|uniref:Uncharacterized protein n=1 Tax=Heterodera schachtii TaxID=97005 RepID=A0ABD2I4V2_HETSC